MGDMSMRGTAASLLRDAVRPAVIDSVPVLLRNQERRGCDRAFGGHPELRERRHRIRLVEPSLQIHTSAGQPNPTGRGARGPASLPIRSV